jgi:hypothetical protein
MPKCFRFKTEYHDRINDIEGETAEFRCYLESAQCRANTITQRARCQNNAVVGLPYCYHHAKIHLNLVIKPSTNMNRDGKGVYAHSVEPRAQREVVFREGDVICHFYGQIRTRDDMNRRYGDVEQLTAPYAIQITQNRFIDAACKRSMASMINHAPPSRANVRFKLQRGPHGRVTQIAIVALRNILHGTELLIDYGYAQRGFRAQPLTHKTYDCRYSRTWDRYYRHK